MAAATQLQRDADELAELAGITVDIEQEGAQVFVLLRKVVLPAGTYQLAATDAMFMTDSQYPVSAMDMFWVEVPVLLASGAIPAGAESIETYRGVQWRRFSWHRNGSWNPTGNPLLDHFEFMQDRFAKDAAS